MAKTLFEAVWSIPAELLLYSCCHYQFLSISRKFLIPGVLVHVRVVKCSIYRCVFNVAFSNMCHSHVNIGPYLHSTLWYILGKGCSILEDMQNHKCCTLSHQNTPQLPMKLPHTKGVSQIHLQWILPGWCQSIAMGMTETFQSSLFRGMGVLCLGSVQSHLHVEEKT